MSQLKKTPPGFCQAADEQLKQLSAVTSYTTPRLCSPTTTRFGRNAASSTAIVFKGWAAPHINTSNAANPFSGQV